MKRKATFNYSPSKGFTLVELIVVIGIIGILAAALLAALDPLEQLRKGRDTSTRSTAVEYHKALTRYYATHGVFPWNNPDVTGCPAPTGGQLGVLGTCTNELVAEGELKAGFIQTLANSGNGQRILINVLPAPGEVGLCFSPESKSIRSGADIIYAAACDGSTNTATCTVSADARRTVPANTCYQLIR